MSLGQSLRSPGPSSNIPGSLQSSPMPKSRGGTSPPAQNDVDNNNRIEVSSFLDVLNARVIL